MVKLKAMTTAQFAHYSTFSFENFVNEVAKSSGQTKEELNRKLSTPPKIPSQNDLWYVIQTESANAGFLWVQLHPAKQEAFLYDIYVEPALRSKGIGREVLENCKMLLQAYPTIEKIKLCVFQDNIIARNLYMSLGFQEVDFSSERRQFTFELNLKDSP